MIWHRNYIPPTREEKRRIVEMLALGCAACKQEPPGWPAGRACVHHIVEGNRRLGHIYTIPLCAGHHQGIWTRAQRHYMQTSAIQMRAIALSDGSKLFVERYGTEREMWGDTQLALDLPVIWPESKILPRRLPTPVAGNGGTVGRGIAETTRSTSDAEISL